MVIEQTVTHTCWWQQGLLVHFNLLLLHFCCTQQRCTLAIGLQCSHAGAIEACSDPVCRG